MLSKCRFCDYETNRKYNLIRHENAKHNNMILSEKYKIKKEGNDNIFEGNDNIFEGNDNIFEGNDNISKYSCQKCMKTYKTKKHLLQHEMKCNKLDSLTCPRCMKSFSHRNSKNVHVKRNKCDARSIIHAQNIKNINNITNIGTQNNIIINNYGSERIDYISFDKLLSIMKKGFNAPSLLTNEIHFNNNFPENMNIKCKDKTTALIKNEGSYKIHDIKILAEELLNNKSNIIQEFAFKNKEKICENMDMSMYEDIADLILKLLVKEPLNQYNRQIKKIIGMIRDKS